MNKKWLLIFVAAFFEVCWVTGLKHAEDPLAWIGTIFSIIISFYILISVTDSLPISTVYAVFTGLGAVGTVLVEILFYSTSFSWVKIGLCTVLISGVIGLKVVTPERDATKGEV
ncbi:MULTISPECIES: DMT family transporter [Metabacillus]|jgi:paired small multidrug resistance pump|uniref:Multidrug resistance protein SMR n=3 Tax=Metabacillus TaxID=2675233 RepID=A0A179T0M8_9BACI|nr:MULTISPECIES: SMR family transporter [Metabacillus]OAS87646.1 multidrug resistance protein SMR [Metabacillus litoralis]QNF26954.1 QacE family quaternary ammonium compound efflux SMR transporter [Metabacillus sp. KUDC1714]